MLRGMSSRLFAEWIAYYKLEPWVDELIDAHMARQAAIQTSTKDKPQDPDKFRVWMKPSDGEFDPQSFYDGLRDIAVMLKDK